MSKDMAAPTPWRSLVAASSRRGISSLKDFKDYISQRDSKQSLTQSLGNGAGLNMRQSWREWAGEKIRYRRTQSFDPAQLGPNERVSLFPGWAVRRYRNTVASQNGLEAFEVDVFVSGFASSHRSPENASRAQRAFMRLAKSFASLPKLVADVADPESGPSTPLSRSTEDLLASVQLPPRPSEITEDYEVQALEQQLQRVNHQSSLDTASPSNNGPTRGYDSSLWSEPTSIPSAVASDLRKLHENLENRLRPFWSSALPSRTVRVSLYAAPHQGDSGHSGEANLNHGVLETKEFCTTADGSFQGHFTLKWEDLCQHPGGLHIAFGDAITEHDLIIYAELLPPPPSSSSTPSSSSDEASPTSDRGQTPYAVYKPNAMKFPDNSREDPQPTAVSKLRVSLTHSPIRVISDIDDTIKRSNILSGARAVFHNVFVKELKDIVIPGMGEWYTNMWSKGVRFHYVSNGPFELLPVVSDFFQVSQLPPGSIKLKSYAGRSLFNGLLSAPATRKRAGILDILDSFPESRFILIGDSGEQDLELYAEFAKERPNQILGVFIRYVEDKADMIDDPTGWKAIGATSTTGMLASSTLASLNRPITPKNQAPSTPVINQPTPRRTLSDVLSNKNTPKPKSLSLSLPIPSLSPSPVLVKTPSGKSERTGYFTSSPLTADPDQHSSFSGSPGRKGSDGQFATPSSDKVPGAWSNNEGIRGSSILSVSPSITSGNTSSSMSSAYLRMSEPDKKKYDLQTRVYRARTQMPGHIPLRIFKTPEDCVEVDYILNREGM